MLGCPGNSWLEVHKNIEVGIIIQFPARSLNPARQIWLEGTCLLVFISSTSRAFLFLSRKEKFLQNTFFGTEEIITHIASYVYHYHASLIFISYNCNGVLMIVHSLQYLEGNQACHHPPLITLNIWAAQTGSWKLDEAFPSSDNRQFFSRIWNICTITSSYLQT